MCKQIGGGLITGGNFQTLPKTSISRNASRENCSWKFSSRKWTCFTDRDCRCRRHHRRRWRRLLRRRCWCHSAKTSTKWTKPLPGWISSFLSKREKNNFPNFCCRMEFSLWKRLYLSLLLLLPMTLASPSYFPQGRWRYCSLRCSE